MTIITKITQGALVLSRPQGEHVSLSEPRGFFEKSIKECGVDVHLPDFIIIKCSNADMIQTDLSIATSEKVS